MAVTVGLLAGDESESLHRLVRDGGRLGVVVRLTLMVVRQVLVDQRVRHRPTRKGERGDEQDPGHATRRRGHCRGQDTPCGCRLKAGAPAFGRPCRAALALASTPGREAA